jgi:hypothetical protein
MCIGLNIHVKRLHNSFLMLYETFIFTLPRFAGTFIRIYQYALKPDNYIVLLTP